MLFQKAKKLPQKPGVYLFKKGQEVLYVGKAVNLRSRVSSYFSAQNLPKTKKMLSQANRLSHILVNSELEALLLEARLIRRYQPPYNWRSKDDKSPIYLKISSEQLPKVSLERKTNLHPQDLYFGPFPSAKLTRRVLRTVRRAIPFSTHSDEKGSPCLHSHLGLCSPCPRAIRKLPPKDQKPQIIKYRHQISQLKRLLKGNSSALLDDLKASMQSFSAQENFEQAAKFRDRVLELEHILTPSQNIAEYLSNPQLVQDLRLQEEQELLHLLKEITLVPQSQKTLKRIEGYDISRSGTDFIVGSLVSFLKAEPDKSHYRRFRLRRPDARDDSAWLTEVLTRRLNRSDWPLPDLFLLDGGRPQVSAILRLFLEKGIEIPFLGLAKKKETLIWYRHGFHQKRLPRHHPALHLLQRVRDESHRFAHRYQDQLKRKLLLSS